MPLKTDTLSMMSFKTHSGNRDGTSKKEYNSAPTARRDSMTKYEELLASKKRQHGDKFDDSDLVVKFAPFFNSQERITVEFSFGETKRGTIGVTTGWKPIFLLMLTKRSTGSSWTINNDDKVILSNGMKI